MASVLARNLDEAFHRPLVDEALHRPLEERAAAHRRSLEEARELLRIGVASQMAPGRDNLADIAIPR